VKVLFVSNSYPTKTHPTKQVFIRNMREEMEKQNISTQLIFNPFYTLSRRITSKKNILLKSIKALGLVFSTLFGLRKYFRCDVVFSHAILFPTYYSILLKPLHKKPVICYIHGGDLNAYIDSTGILYKLMLKSLKKTDQVICNSLDIQKKVINLGIESSKVHIAPPGVDLGVMKDLNRKSQLKNKFQLEDKFVLLSIGNAIRRKGHDQLFKALNMLMNKNETLPFHLILVSEGKEIHSYNEFISKYQMNDLVSVRPYVNQKKLVDFYNVADVFIFPSREEPLGLAAIEAMACGTPVIGTNVGGISEVLSDNAGFLFEPENIEELAKLIEKIYSVDYNSEQLHVVMKEKVDKYGLTQNVKKMIEICKLEFDERN